MQNNVVDPVRGAITGIPGAWQSGVVEPTQQAVGHTQQFLQTGVVQPAASVVEKVPAAYDTSVQAVVQGWNTVTDNVWLPVATAAVTWWTKPGALPSSEADTPGSAVPRAEPGAASSEQSTATAAGLESVAATSAAVATRAPGADTAADSPEQPPAQPAASGVPGATTDAPVAGDAGTTEALLDPTDSPAVDPVSTDAPHPHCDSDAGFHDCEEEVSPAAIEADLPTEESMEATLAALEANMIQAGAPHGAIKETVANVRSAMMAALAAKRAA